MYYIKDENDKIILFDEDIKTLQDTINLIPQYKGFKILEVPKGCVIDNFELITIQNSQQKQKEQQRQIINELSLTKREVFLALYEDKGITPEQLRNQITDKKALIEFDYANDYYRGNPLIEQIGASLGYTSNDLDYLFQNKKLPKKETKDE